MALLYKKNKKEKAATGASPVAAPMLAVDWSEGSGSSGLNLQALNVALLCKNKKEGGSARASPVTAPMLKSVFF